MTDKPGSASSSLPSNSTCMPTHTPNTGRPVSDEVADRRRRARGGRWRACTRRSGRRRGSPGRRRSPTSAGSPVINAACRRRARARARPNGGCRSRSRHGDRRDRSSQGSFGRGDAGASGEAHASPSAFAIALNVRLADVVGRASVAKVDVDRHVGALRERPHEVLHQPGVELPDRLGRHRHVVHDEVAARQIERRPRPPPRRAAPRSRRTAGCPPCRRAPRPAPARSRCRRPPRCGGRRPARSPLHVDVQVPAGVLAELLQHVVEERDAGVGARRFAEPSRFSSTLMSVSFVVRVTLGGAAHAGSTSWRLVRNRSTSCSAPAVTRKRVGHHRGEVANQHAAIEQRLPHLLRVAGSAARTARSSRPTGTPSCPRSRGARGRCDRAAHGSRPAPPWPRSCAQRRDAGGLGQRGHVIRKAHPLQVRHHLRAT